MSRRRERGEKVVWNCAERTRISNPDAKPTPAQVRSEVWMAIAHGSMGIIWFVHQFQPRFVEAGAPPRSAEVLDEARSIEIRDGAFEDDFGSYAAHIYRIPE